MSLMSTLAKVAVGVAVAKGVGHMMKKPDNATGSAGGLLGGQASAAQQSSGGGLENLMGSLLGGGQGSAGGGAGGLGGILEQLSGAGGAGGAGGGLNDVLGGLMGGGGGAGGASGGLGGLMGALGGGSSGGGGGLGGLLGALGGAAGSGSAAGGLGGLLGALSGGATEERPQASFGEVLNSSFSQNDTPEIPPSPAQEVAAALMLRSMIQAAKCDGNLDEAEKEKLLGKLGDISPEEMEFVQAELGSPVDVNGLASQVPQGLEAQVYAMSVMAIDLDSQAEAQYLDQFAKALGLQGEMVNGIHNQLGIPALYA